MLMLNIDQEMSWGFIGGTSQGDPFNSGVETILYFDSYHYFNFKICLLGLLVNMYIFKLSKTYNKSLFQVLIYNLTLIF